MIGILAFTIFVFILNIPFGYWRSNTLRFSRDWYLAIHIPVLPIIVLRVFLDLGWSWQSYALLLPAFFLGQIMGHLVRSLYKNYPDE